MRINISMWRNNAKKIIGSRELQLGTCGRLPRKKFFFGDIVLALPFILSLILYLINQGEFSMQQDKKI